MKGDLAAALHQVEIAPDGLGLVCNARGMLGVRVPAAQTAAAYQALMNKPPPAVKVVFEISRVPLSMGEADLVAAMTQLEWTIRPVAPPLLHRGSHTWRVTAEQPPPSALIEMDQTTVIVQPARPRKTAASWSPVSSAHPLVVGPVKPAFVTARQSSSAHYAAAAERGRRGGLGSLVPVPALSRTPAAAVDPQLAECEIYSSVAPTAALLAEKMAVQRHLEPLQQNIQQLQQQVQALREHVTLLES